MYTRLVLFLLLTHFAGSAGVDVSQLPWDNQKRDGDELEVVKKFLVSNPVILEAGACGGEDTVNFIEMWPNATVHAFEPVPSFFERLKHTVGTVVGKLTNVHLYPFGLYTTSGVYEFNLCQGKTPGGASSLFPSAGLSECPYDERPIQIVCKNLDEWAEEYGVDHIDYMWLDMEGAEYAVLNSAPIILKTVKAISCELNFREFRKTMPQFKDVYDLLIKEGFVLHTIWGSPTWQAIGIFIRSELL